MSSDFGKKQVTPSSSRFLDSYVGTPSSLSFPPSISFPKAGPDFPHLLEGAEAAGYLVPLLGDRGLEASLQPFLGLGRSPSTAEVRMGWAFTVWLIVWLMGGRGGEAGKSEVAFLGCKCPKRTGNVWVRKT